jgi:hypothetical protein
VSISDSALPWAILGGSLAGTAVGVLLVLAAEIWHWRRARRRYNSQPIANLMPPTLTELNRPDWMEDA